MEEALKTLLPLLIAGRSVEWRIINHASKRQLLRALPVRLQGYSNLRPHVPRVLVLVDRDNDDCLELKRTLEAVAKAAGLTTKTAPGLDGFAVVNRIVVEELEAWFFGDVPALRAAFPKIPGTLEAKARYRNPDAIVGGTWEALLRELKSAGYYPDPAGLPKTEVARLVAGRMTPSANRSHSFRAFQSGLEALIAT